MKENWVCERDASRRSVRAFVTSAYPRCAVFITVLGPRTQGPGRYASGSDRGTLGYRFAVLERACAAVDFTLVESADAIVTLSREHSGGSYVRVRSSASEQRRPGAFGAYHRPLFYNALARERPAADAELRQTRCPPNLAGTPVDRSELPLAPRRAFHSVSGL